MKSDKKTEKAFELIEQYEFAELSGTDKKYILSVMSESEYNILRSTIIDLPNYFEKEIEVAVKIPPKEESNKSYKLIKILFYPLQLYKVAAGVIIAVSLFNTYVYFNKNYHQGPLAKNDTVFVHKTDTIFQIIYDTIYVVEKGYDKSKHILMAKNNSNKEIKLSNKYYKNEFQPNDIDKIMAMTNNNNSLSNDSVLKAILALLD